jgi:broad specificity phosphatase PhoE
MLGGVYSCRGSVHPARTPLWSLVIATFLLIRHAAHVQLDTILSGRSAGLALSYAGRMQAAGLARTLGSVGLLPPGLPAGPSAGLTRLTHVQASPLDRTMQTAQTIANAVGLSVEPVAALNEIDFGDWTGRPFSDLEGADWDAWNSHRATARVPGGESMVEAQARIMHHLRRMADALGDATVAIVTHCDMIRAAVADVIGLSLDHLLRFEIAPASVTRLVLDAGVPAPWGARVTSLNERMW